jgi:ribosomal protein L11 methyltransferase
LAKVTATASTLICDAPTEKSAAALVEALGNFVDAVSWAETGQGWRVAAYCEATPDEAALRRTVAEAAAQAGIAPPEVAIAPLPQVDWLRQNRASFKPQRARRFYIHDGEHRDAPPSATIAIQIDAATAFGSGNHATTQGCLLAIDRLARRGWAGRVLDLGCGSGILALAAAKALHAQVLAADFDPEAVRVTRANARLNGVGARVRAVKADGFRRRVIRARAPFALILANILARPLVKLAPGLAAALAPGGFAVLSGLLVAQEREVMGAYRAQGLRLVARWRRNGWATLMLGRPLAPSPTRA